ncbi:mucin-15 [Choloepus didactylus]|uniref:mucin-15 n=1 Tax=Choloepus didactylus TaxID=27675 RepID=UPI00189C7EEA|nr:mucin-15 [Choloepus didactylus]
MLTSVKILLISILSSLVFGGHGKERPEINTTQHNAVGLKLMEHETVSVENEVKLDSDKENRETSSPKANNSSSWDIINKIHGMTNFPNAFSTDNSSENPRSTATFFTNPPLVHGFVSKLPWNSSVANENSSSVAASPNAVSAQPSEEFTWSFNNLTNDIMQTASDNSSSVVGILPTAPATTSVTPLLTEPTGWLTTTSDILAGFTPYQETTTPQPTLKFTNNSKIFPNTSDPQEENRNTGVVFGAILGAILGASLLSLVGYLLCGRRKTDSFSHRRLYDDRNEPVLRLDNAPEPYDASFGNSSYYNPTVTDSSTPEGQENACDGIPMDDIPPLRNPV